MSILIKLMQENLINKLVKFYKETLSTMKNRGFCRGTFNWRALCSHFGKMHIKYFIPTIKMTLNLPQYLVQSNMVELKYAVNISAPFCRTVAYQNDFFHR